VSVLRTRDAVRRTARFRNSRWIGVPSPNSSGRSNACRGRGGGLDGRGVRPVRVMIECRMRARVAVSTPDRPSLRQAARSVCSFRRRAPSSLLGIVTLTSASRRRRGSESHLEGWHLSGGMVGTVRPGGPLVLQRAGARQMAAHRVVAAHLDAWRRTGT
jgi:hypothetical protein